MMICFQFCFFSQFLTVKGGHDPEQILAVPPQFGLLFESHKHQMVLSIEATTAGSIDLQHKTAPLWRSLLALWFSRHQTAVWAAEPTWSQVKFFE